MNENELEKSVKGILAKVKEGDHGPHPFLKSRIISASREINSSRKKMFFWKSLSLLTSVCLIFVMFSNVKRNEKNVVPLNNSYVIHMQFSEEDAVMIANAEVTLPDDVQFYSASNPEIKTKKTLVLPVKVSVDGRTKLPFVVMATAPGKKKILVRLLDNDQNLIKHSYITVTFNKRS